MRIDNSEDRRDFLTRAPSGDERERLLQKFRCGFVNIALPMLAFTQPVTAEIFEVPLNLLTDSTIPPVNSRHFDDNVVLDDSEFQDVGDGDCGSEVSRRNNEGRIHRLLHQKKQYEFSMWDTIKVRNFSDVIKYLAQIHNGSNFMYIISE